MDRDPTDPLAAAQLAAGQLVAWLLLGLVNVVISWATLPFPKSVGTRLLMHGYDLGQMLALGLLSAGLVLAWRRLVPPKRWLGYAALALLSAAASQLLLLSDLRGVSRILGLTSWQLWSRVFAVLFSLCIPLSAWLSAKLARSKLRFAVLLVGLLVAVAHQLVLPNLYLGIHAYGSWCAAALLGGALPVMLRPLVDAIGRRPPKQLWTLRAFAVLLALCALLWPAPSRVRSQLNQLPGALVARYKPELPIAALSGDVPQAKADWFRDRSQLPDIPPSRARLLPQDGIVIVFLIDAMRADVMNAPSIDKLPTLRALKARGVTFTHAWSPAPNTNPSVAAMHAGRYPAQIRWAMKAVGKNPRLWPDDDGLRVGDLLAQKPVESMLVVSQPMGGLKPEYELTKGLGTEVKANNQYSRTVVKAFLDWLPNQREAPLLAYLHVTDAHAPYNLGGRRKDKWEGYLAELALIDRALSQLLDGLRAKGLDERTLLMITADHGEAFGEHNSWFHGTTVYDEMMRVPLLVVGKGIEPRTIEQPVTTLDLAPTLLDLFGVDTPATMMGQSLAPLLAGGDTRLTRPVFLDSHSETSGMVFDDGTKLVVRRGVPELYDLKADPKELDNIYDSHPHAAARFGEYQSFVRAHRMKFEKP